MKRPRWSKHKKLAALFSLGIATSVANAQAPIVSVATGGAGRTPVATQSVSARIPGSYGLAAPGAGQANPLAPANQPAFFEGPASTDYFNNQNGFSTSGPANPQIAVGPEDILMTVNSQIFRVQNGNAPGVIPPTVYPAQTAFVLGTPSQTIGATPASFQRAFLDQWIGATALSQLCPTGDPTADQGNSRVMGLTCLFENATTKYDQLHGRFLVLFTVTDTGLTQTAQGQGYALTRPRKSSWVLLVSRFAVLADQACLQGTTCPAGGTTTPVSNGAGTSIFITPTTALAGGINSNIWSIEYGSALGTNPADTFGSQVASGGVGAGNINANSTLTNAAAATYFDCGPNAVYTGTGAGAIAPASGTVCYLPTSARLGIDNDTVTIASSVINGNIPTASSGAIFNVAPPAGPVGSGASATATIATNGVSSITVGNAGSGYTSAPTVTIAGGGGTGATAIATLNAAGSVSGFTITAPGSGYTTAPTVTLTGGGGTGATATATVGSFVSSITVNSGGAGYTTAPTVTLTGGGGTGATATANVTNGVVTSVTITNGGNGYTTAPTVTFTSAQGPAGVPTAPDYAGTRVRVIKKSALYTRLPANPPLVPGNQFATTATGRTGGEYYDLFTAVDAAGTPVLNTTAGGSPNMPFTVVASAAACAATTAGVIPGVSPQTTITRCTPVFYEPAHLRGRAQATFSNSSSGVGTASLSQTYLLGAIYNSTTTPTGILFLQGIREIYPNAASTPGTGGVFGIRPFYPVLQTAAGATTGSGTTADVCLASSPLITTPGSSLLTCIAPANGAPTADLVPVEPFFNPLPVAQGGTNSPNLSVGDDRPHTLIFREGHLYDARVGIPSNPFGIFTGGNLLTTVIYDIIQKLNNGPTGPVPGALTAPNPVLGTKWQNTSAYAPMFDVPANVSRVGVISPINVLPYLEKLFVATTYPPLAGSALTPVTGTQLVSGVALDPFQSAGDPRSRQTYGVSGPVASQLPASANCWNYQYSPGPSTPDAPGTTPALNNPLAFASLFDMRCGQDVTNSNPQIRNPFSGVFDASGGSTGFGSGGSVYTLTHRGGAGIDPNDGSMWNYGAYAQQRATSTNSLSHFGTFAANYKLSFSSTDPYGNNYNLYTDIAGLPEAPYIMMAANNGLATFPGAFPAGVSGNTTNGGPDAPNTVAISQILPGPNSTLYGPATAGNTVPGTAPGANKFGPNDEVTRREMAYWIVKSVMDESAISAEITATGGVFATFADVPTTDPGWRYVEIMARRGYTSGCAAGAARRYCPDFIATRKDLAVFMIRAKFNNVFASLLSGCSFGFVNGTTPGGTTTTVTPGLLIPPALTTNCGTTGDNFAAFVTGLPYFLDNPAQTGNDEYVYLQKMRELRITNGTSLGPNNDGRNGTYGRGTPNLPASQYAASTIPGSDASQLNGNLLRKQVAVFMVRGFFF